MNNLLTPRIQVNAHDGYAYIFPSNVLPIAIASGVDFEHITGNTNFEETLHPRSKYRSPDIRSLLSTLFNDTNSMISDHECSLENDDEVYYVGLGLWSDGCDAGGP